MHPVLQIGQKAGGVLAVLVGPAIIGVVLGFGAVVLAAGELTGRVSERSGAVLVVESSAGEMLRVLTNADTRFSGPEDTRLALADIGAGDRVRVRTTENPRGESVAAEIQVEARHSATPDETGSLRQRNPQRSRGELPGEAP
jgi:hypothetical protein